MTANGTNMAAGQALQRYSDSAPTFGDLAEACKRAYADSGDPEYLGALDRLEETRARFAAGLTGAFAGANVDNCRPALTAVLPDCVRAAWMTYRRDIEAGRAVSPVTAVPDEPPMTAARQRWWDRPGPPLGAMLLMMVAGTITLMALAWLIGSVA
jgi:hypothetical protein